MYLIKIKKYSTDRYIINSSNARRTWVSKTEEVTVGFTSCPKEAQKKKREIEAKKDSSRITCWIQFVKDEQPVAV